MRKCFNKDLTGIPKLSTIYICTHQPDQHWEDFSCMQNAGYKHAEDKSKEGGLLKALPCTTKE
jgi:hypothetical protein